LNILNIESLLCHCLIFFSGMSDKAT
jgi:hypothetical protein